MKCRTLGIKPKHSGFFDGCIFKEILMLHQFQMSLFGVGFEHPSSQCKVTSNPHCFISAAK